MFFVFFCQIIMITKHSRSLFHQIVANGVQFRNESVKLLNGSVLLFEAVIVKKENKEQPCLIKTSSLFCHSVDPLLARTLVA